MHSNEAMAKMFANNDNTLSSEEVPQSSTVLLS